VGVGGGRGGGRAGPAPQRVAVAALFGVLTFLSKAPLPSPVDKITVIVQALSLALGHLLLGLWGATFVALVGGALTALWRAPMAPFSIGFALVYGLLVDGLSVALRVRAPGGRVRERRLTAAVTVATAVVGLTSYYATVYVARLLTRNLVMEVVILVGGTLSGLGGGYLAALIWRKALRHLKLE